MKVGRQALETVKKFLEQREFTTEEDIRYVRDIIRRLDEPDLNRIYYLIKLLVLLN